MAEPTCTICQKTGPVLMPLRYAIAPDTITQQLPAWATPQTAFPALSGYHYALRALRQGFIYVFYNTGALPENVGFDWECWSVAENGDLYYQGTTGLGAQLVFNPPPCGRPVHKATNLEHMALSEKALKYETWVAFSHAPWEAEALDLYTRDANARAKRMQNITPAEWNSHILAQENGLVQASEAALNTVLDYQTTPPFLLRDEERSTYRVSSLIDGQYGFYQESVNPHTTFHAWSRQRAGGAERSMKAMQSRCQASSGKPISPLILALQDPVGITHELAHWGDTLALAHQCYLDELSVEFATWRNINGVKSQVEQMTTAQQAEYANEHGGQDLQLLYRTMGGTYSREQIRQFYEEGNAWARNQGIAYDWSTYTAKLAPGKLDQFKDAYDGLCKELDKQTRALMGLRINWLQDSRFITCIQDHNRSRVEDNLYYREIVGYAVASLNVAPAGRQLIQTWINAYSSQDNTNLFWRSQFFNDPALMSEMAPALEAMKKQAAKKDEPESEGERAGVMPLMSQFMGWMGKLNESADRALEALERDAKAAEKGLGRSATRQILAKADRWLQGAAEQVFNTKTLGKVSDRALELMHKAFFAAHVGIVPDKVMALFESEVDPGPEGAKAFRTRVIERMKARTDVKADIYNKYTEKYKEFIEEPGGALSMRIKILGAALSIYEYGKARQEYQELEEKGGQASSGKKTKAWMEMSSAGLFAINWHANALMPALEAMGKSAGGGSKQAMRLLAGKYIANGAGSMASILAVGVDFMEFEESWEENGTEFWKSISLSGAKLASDSAYAIQTTDELLALCGRGFMEELTVFAAKKLGAFVLSQTIARIVVGWGGFLASWPVMIAVNLAPVLVMLLTDNKLQSWCEQCVFGVNADEDVKNPRSLPEEQRKTVEEEQQDKLEKALHEVFGLPLSEKLEKKEVTEAGDNVQENYSHGISSKIMMINY
ncbi:hypothetical protein EGD30_25470 [Salmonella enterica]|nr:hypothetical protein [Salmonella enterica]